MKQQQRHSIITRKWLPFALIALLTIIIYSSSLYHEVNIDDEIILNAVPEQVTFNNLASVFTERYNGTDYRPITIFTFAFERYLIGKPSLVFSHAINILLYIFLCSLVYVFFSQLYTKEKSSIIPLLTTLFFCVHPLHVSVVASLKSRDNILSLLLATISFLVLFKAKSEHPYKRYFYILLSFIIFYISTFAKMDSLGFVFLFPVFYFVFIRKNWIETIVVLLLFFTTVTITRDMFIDAMTGPVDFYSKVTFEENPLVVQSTFINKISMAFLTLGYYLKFMIIPKGYYFYFGYAMLDVLPIYHPLIIVSIVIHICILMVGIVQFKKNKILFFSILGYFACLLYAVNYIVPVAGVVADRYGFISSMFFCNCLAILLITLKEKTSFIPPNYRLISLTSVLLVIYIFFSYARNGDWKSRETLYEADLPYVQKSVNALRMIAEHEITQSSKTSTVTEKQQHLNKAITLCDNALLICDSLSVLYQIKANAQFTLKQKSLAFETIQTGIDKSYENTGSLATKAEFFARENNLDSAIQYYQKTLLKDTSQAEIFVKMIDLKNKKGLFQESMKESMLLIKDRPHFLAGYQNVANTYLYMGDTLLAVNYFIEAFKRGVENPEMAQGIKEYFINKGMNERLPEIEPYTQ
ncbi:MAG: hypothetical protein K1X55_10615 [Chitinophagales bacterium]|nr:hypothetical protein [Chitinophagales bacterium]